MLVRFITDTYFTTFLTLQLQEDQTSSIIIFLLERYPGVCVRQSESLSLHTHMCTHIHTEKHMVMTSVKLCIAKINDYFFYLTILFV